MCGRYTLRRVDRIQTAFQIRVSEAFKEFSQLKITPRFNIAPSQHVPIIRINAPGERTLSLVRWGLIPSWTKGKPKLQPINARAETIATSGMFRQAFDCRRCLVPADGFYEWQKFVAPDGKPAKQPMYMHRHDDEPFAFAGLWERWKPDEEAESVDTFTIVTTTPNALLSPIHDRMPVILAQRDYQHWLDRETPAKAVADLLKPYADEDFEALPVSTRVNSPRNDDCDCIAPVAE